MLSRKNIMPLLAIGEMMGGFSPPQRHLLIDGKVPAAPLPKGTKEYFFAEDGTEVTDLLYAFKCIAINDKNAKRKFNNWQKEQHGK